MTRDEIMALKAGRELDGLVAKQVVGWKVLFEYYPGLQLDLIGINHVGCQDLVPHYSTNIAAAWEVVNTFNRVEWDIEVGSLTDDDGKLWCVVFTKWSDQPIGSIACGGNSDASLPLAICRAALLAVQE